MGLPVIMHVNYCEQGQTIEEICFKAAEWGFDGVEFRRKRTTRQEGVEEYLDAIADGARRSGLKQVLFGAPGPDLMSGDAAKRESDIKDMEQFCILASERFKLTVCNTMAGLLKNPDTSVPAADYDRHGSHAASDEQWEWAAEGFKVLGKLAEKLDFRFAFESHMNYIHDLPLAAKKLVDLIGNPAVGVNLDYGNTVYFKEVPALRETIAAMENRLYYVHLKNSIGMRDGGKFPTALSEGQINHREYLRLLKEFKYEGPICIEAPRNGDRELFARQDLAYIKSVMKDVGI